MSQERNGLSRRTVLEAVGGSLAATGAAGLAGAAGDDLVRANVGYSAESGRRAALDAADEVVYDFAFDALTLRLSAEAMAALAARPDVRYVEEDGALGLHGQIDSWGYERIDADDANAVGHTGAGVDIAILDTGIDADHDDLSPNLGTGKAVISCSDTCSEPWDDDKGHGTWVAGIVGAVDDDDGVVGVAPDATLHAVKVCDDDDESNCPFSEVAKGLEWAADQGHDVANMSLGGGHSDTLADAIDYADTHGVFMVASAGNSGECTDCVKYPASDSDVVAVSAIDGNDDLAGFSSQGPEVELTAPGVSIETTDIGGGVQLDFDGTSASAPHVAGVGALLMAGPYTGPEARGRLRETAEDLGLSSNEQGYGLVDAQAAVALDVETEFPSNVGSTSATLEGELADLGEASSVDVYFEWRQDDSTDWNTTSRQTLSSPAHFDATIDDLFTGTWYEYRAVADASDGDGETGDIQRFQTDGDIEPMGGTTGGS